MKQGGSEVGRTRDAKQRAPGNRTIQCDRNEYARLSEKLLVARHPLTISEINGRVIWGDVWETIPHLPQPFVDLLILDPPYNLSKNYNGRQFKRLANCDYARWFEETLMLLKPVLKPESTVYVCSDWKTSLLVAPILDRHFHLRNRITWERDKGRGANTNWKNNSEDIWFCTTSKSYYFDISAVKMKRKVIAPYKQDGIPKDWTESETGNFRITFPSNLWTDITVPFWSMPENTDHPTQKPEKLIAKLVLASSPVNGFVLDPFLGSGTTGVVAKKLGRRFCGIEIDHQFGCWSVKRLEMVDQDSRIQGYEEGVFWERNTLAAPKRNSKAISGQEQMII